MGKEEGKKRGEEREVITPVDAARRMVPANHYVDGQGRVIARANGMNGQAMEVVGHVSESGAVHYGNANGRPSDIPTKDYVWERGA